MTCSKHSFFSQDDCAACRHNEREEREEERHRELIAKQDAYRARLEEIERAREDEARERERARWAREEAIARQREIQIAESRYRQAENHLRENPTLENFRRCESLYDDLRELSEGTKKAKRRDKQGLFEDLLPVVVVVETTKSFLGFRRKTKYGNRSSIKKSVQDAASHLRGVKGSLDPVYKAKQEYDDLVQHPIMRTVPTLRNEILAKLRELQSKYYSELNQPETAEAIRILEEAKHREANLKKSHAWYYRKISQLFGLSKSAVIAFTAGLIIVMYVGFRQEPGYERKEIFVAGVSLDILSAVLFSYALLVGVISFSCYWFLESFVRKWVSFLPPRS